MGLRTPSDIHEKREKIKKILDDPRYHPMTKTKIFVTPNLDCTNDTEGVYAKNTTGLDNQNTPKDYGAKCTTLLNTLAPTSSMADLNLMGFSFSGTHECSAAGANACGCGASALAGGNAAGAGVGALNVPLSCSDCNNGTAVVRFGNCNAGAAGTAATDYVTLNLRTASGATSEVARSIAGSADIKEVAVDFDNGDTLWLSDAGGNSVYGLYGLDIYCRATYNN